MKIKPQQEQQQQQQELANVTRRKSQFNRPFLKRQLQDHHQQRSLPKFKYLNQSQQIIQQTHQQSQYQTPQTRRPFLQNPEYPPKTNQDCQMIQNFHLSSSAQTMSSTPGHRISSIENQLMSSDKKNIISPKILGGGLYRDPFVSSSQNVLSSLQQHQPHTSQQGNDMIKKQYSDHNLVTDFHFKINESPSDFMKLSPNRILSTVKKEKKQQQYVTTRMTLRKSRIDQGEVNRANNLHYQSCVLINTNNPFQQSYSEEISSSTPNHNNDQQYQGLKNITIELFNLIFGRMIQKGVRKFQKKNIASELVQRFRFASNVLRRGSNSKSSSSSSQAINSKKDRSKHKLYRFYPTKVECNDNLDADQFQAAQKADKNVRRRVYDAINVLLAVNVLEQNVGGKDVSVPNRLRGLSRLLHLMHERKYLISVNKNGVQPETELQRIKNLKQLKLIQLAQKKKQLKLAINQNFNLRNLKKRNIDMINQVKKFTLKNDREQKILSNNRDGGDQGSSSSSSSFSSQRISIPNDPVFRNRLLPQPFLILYTVASVQSSLKITRCKGEYSDLTDNICLSTTYQHTIRNLLDFLQYLNLNHDKNYESNMKKLLRLKFPLNACLFLKAELENHLRMLQDNKGKNSDKQRELCSQSKQSIKIFCQKPVGDNGLSSMAKTEKNL